MNLCCSETLIFFAEIISLIVNLDALSQNISINSSKYVLERHIFVSFASKPQKLSLC